MSLRGRALKMQCMIHTYIFPITMTSNVLIIRSSRVRMVWGTFLLYLEWTCSISRKSTCLLYAIEILGSFITISIPYYNLMHHSSTYGNSIHTSIFFIFLKIYSLYVPIEWVPHILAYSTLKKIAYQTNGGKNMR